MVCVGVGVGVGKGNADSGRKQGRYDRQVEKGYRGNREEKNLRDAKQTIQKDARLSDRGKKRKEQSRQGTQLLMQERTHNNNRTED